MRKDVGRLRSSGLETRVGNEVKLEKIWCDVFNIHQGDRDTRSRFIGECNERGIKFKKR